MMSQIFPRHVIEHLGEMRGARADAGGPGAGAGAGAPQPSAQQAPAQDQQQDISHLARSHNDVTLLFME
jgi:hypothetical protein